MDEKTKYLIEQLNNLNNENLNFKWVSKEDIVLYSKTKIVNQSGLICVPKKLLGKKVMLFYINEEGVNNLLKDMEETNKEYG